MQSKHRNRPGRKPIINNLILGKLREAFLWGCTDKEACLHAGINPDTLYEYQKHNSHYSEQKEMYKSNPVLVARKSVVDSLSKDPVLALKYLERKKSDEFSLKQKIEETVTNDKIVGINYIVPDDYIYSEEISHKPGITVIKKSDINNCK